MKRALLLCALLAACGDDDASVPETPDASAPVTDAGPPTVEDAAAPEAKAIPLVDWVDDLLDHHTDDTSAPDTVDDKKIDDDEDPTTFDRRF